MLSPGFKLLSVALLDANRRKLAAEYCLEVGGITENLFATLSDLSVVLAEVFEIPEREPPMGNGPALFAVLFSTLGSVRLVDVARFDVQTRWNADRGTRDNVFEPFDKYGLTSDRETGPASHEYVIFDLLAQIMASNCKHLQQGSRRS